MSTFTRSRPVQTVAAWLCATFALGCPAAQVMPPALGSCPNEIMRSMSDLEWSRGHYEVTIDINQPGEPFVVGVFHSGPIVSRVEESSTPLPVGTLLYGQLWTEELYFHGRPAVAGRYREALLSDGRHVPICFVLGIDKTGLVLQRDGSKPGAAVLTRRETVLAEP